MCKNLPKYKLKRVARAFTLIGSTYNKGDITNMYCTIKNWHYNRLLQNRYLGYLINKKD